jgi:hypothetical protein
MIDWTAQIDRSQEQIEKTILIVTVYLDRLAMLEALKHEKVFMNSNWYKIPKKELIELLEKEIYGCIELEIEQI